MSLGIWYLAVKDYAFPTGRSRKARRSLVLGEVDYFSPGLLLDMLQFSITLVSFQFSPGICILLK